MFIRFSQPFVFSALVLFWQMVIDNKLYVIIGASVLGGFGFYCAYMYYVDKYMNSNIRGIAPVSAEYEGDLPVAPPSPRAGQQTAPAPGVASQPIRAISRVGVYESDNMVIPVLDQNFEAVPTRRPFGSSKASSDSEAASSRGNKKAVASIPVSKKESTSTKAGANASSKVTSSQKGSASKAPVKVASYEDSPLSSEELLSELDKPSKRKKVTESDSERSRSKERSSSKRASGNKEKEKEKTRDSGKAMKHGKKSHKSRGGRKRTSSDMSVESIPEGEDESEVSELSEREERPRKNKSSKQASKTDAKNKSKSKSKGKEKEKSKSKARKDDSASRRGKKKTRVPSSDSEEDSGSSDGHRFSHSDSSDTSSSDSR
jgi:hypothetical protein